MKDKKLLIDGCNSDKVYEGDLILIIYLTDSGRHNCLDIANINNTCVGKTKFSGGGNSQTTIQSVKKIHYISEEAVVRMRV